MQYTTYNIVGSKGVFYTTKREPTEGYSENTYVDPKTKESKTNYRLEKTELSGKLKFFGMKEVTLQGKEVDMMFITLETSPTTCDSIELAVFNGKSINDYVKAFCQVFDNLQKGADTKIQLNRESKDKKGFLYKNVFVTQDNEKVNWAFKTFGDDSPVPKAVKTQDKVTKKDTWDFSAVDGFFYDILTKYKYTPKPKENTEAAATQPPAESKSVEQSTDITDDLPF